MKATITQSSRGHRGAVSGPPFASTTLFVTSGGRPHNLRQTTAPRPPRPQRDRRYRLTHRLLPVVIIAGLALVVGARRGRAAHAARSSTVAERFAARLGEGRLRGACTPSSSADAKRAYPLDRFRAAYAATAATATATAVSASASPREPKDGVVAVPVTVPHARLRPRRGHARAARSRARATRRASTGAPSSPSPAWPRARRCSAAPSCRRAATILARDGQALAKGARPLDRPRRPSPPRRGRAGADPARAARCAARARLPGRRAASACPGWSARSRPQLAGRPGGTLSVGGRVIARSRPRPGRAGAHDDRARRSSEAAITALGGQSGGDRRDPARDRRGPRRSPGRAYSATGPPGSTFKIITTTAALEDRKVKLTDEFPVETAARAGGRPARQRQRRVVRRATSSDSFAALVQLGVRAARRQGGQASGSSRRPRSSAGTSGR